MLTMGRLTALSYLARPEVGLLDQTGIDKNLELLKEVLSSPYTTADEANTQVLYKDTQIVSGTWMSETHTVSRFNTK